MSGDIVDAIDRALTDYGTSMDAMRWVPEPVVEPSLAEIIEAVNRACRQMIEAIKPMIEAADRFVRDSHDAFVAAGLIPEPIPTDPRERALHLRRTRNVGPDGRIPAGRKRRT